jgi:hypothetical protein
MADGPASTIVFDGDSTGAVAALHAVDVEAKRLAASLKDTASQMNGATNVADPAPTVQKLSTIEKQLRRNVIAAEQGGKDTSGYMREMAKATGQYSAALEPMLQRFDAAKAAQALLNSEFTKSGKVMTEYGMGVKATSAALRQVPAQFTDIIVSLQGGQAPLTVLLQQGGQLKDVFGGVGNAAKALGGYILGLINPYTLAAAGVALLGTAFYKGAAESEAYNKSLILTGNSAGLTAGKLSSMAQAVAASTGGTVGAAAEALATIAGTAGIAAAQYERVSAVAVQMQKLTGAAVSDTVKQFAELGKDPVKASEKLNETTHYLTAAVYEQIRALEDQGKTLEAGALAQKAYADAMDGRLPLLTDNLGYVEKAWRGIMGAAKGAWDSMLNIGRPTADADVIGGLKAQIADLQKNMAYNPGLYGADLKNLKEELVYQQRIQASKGAMAVYDADRVKRDESSIAMAKEAEKYATNATKMKREVAKADADFANSNKTDKDIENYGTRLAGIAKAFKETGDGAAKAVRASKAAMSEAEKGLKLYNDEMAVSVGLTADFAEKQALFAAKFAKDGNLDEYRKGMDAIIAKQPYMVDGLKAEAKALEDMAKARTDGLIAHAKELESLGDKAQKIEDEVMMYGMSKEAIESLTTARMLDQIEVLRGFDNSAEEIARIEQTIAARKRLAAAGASLDVKDVNAKAAKDMAAEQKKAAEESSKYWEDALMRAFESGKGFFQSLWDTIKNTLKTQVLKVMVSATGLTGMTAASAGGADVLGMASTASSLMALTENVGKMAASFNGAGLAAFARSSIGQNAGLSTAATVGNNASAYIAPELTTAGNAFAGLPLGGILTAYSVGGIKGFAMGVASTAIAGGVAAAIAGTSVMAGAGAALAAIGPVGWVALGAAALFGMGDDGPSMQGTGEAGKTFDKTGKAVAGQDYSYLPYGGANDLSNASIDLLQTGYATQAAALGIGMTGLGFTYGGNILSDGSKENFLYGVNGTEAGQTSYRSAETPVSKEAMQLEASRVIFTALSNSELPKYLKGAFDGLSAGAMNQEQLDDWTRGAAAIKGFNDSMQSTPWANLKDMTFIAIQNLSGFAGGIDKLQSSLGSFYENFYTSDVKTANLTAQTSAAFAALGDVMPAADAGMRDWYRSLVESKLALDQNIPANAMATAGTLALQDAVNALAPTFDAAASSISDALKKLKTEASTLAVELLTAQGKTTEAAAAQRALDTAGMSDLAVSQYDTNTATRTLIDSLNAQADSAAALATTNRGWQDQLDILTGKETDRSIALRDATDESTRVIMRQVYAQEDLKTATDAATEAAKVAAQTRLDTATTGANDAMAAVQRAVGAQRKIYQAQADAAQGAMTEIKSIFDTLESSIKTLYGQVDSTQQAAQGRAFIDNALSNAQTTGYLPDSKDLSSAISAAMNDSTVYSSQAEADFQKLALAGSLGRLKEISGTQLTTAEKQLQLAKDQLDNLDQTLVLAQQQLDAANGINTSVLSVADAVSQLDFAIRDLIGIRQAQGLATTGSVTAAAASATTAPSLSDVQKYASVNGGDAYYSIPGVNDAAAKLNAAQGIANILGGTAEDQLLHIYGKPLSYWQELDRQFAAGLAPQLTAYAVGTNYVTSTGPAMLHEGEAVIPKAYNPAAGGQSNERLESLVEGLTKEVQRLQSIVNDGNNHARRTADATNGNPEAPTLVQVVT